MKNCGLKYTSIGRVKFWVKIYLMKIAWKRCNKFGYFMHYKLYMWLISESAEKQRNLETPFACRSKYCYVLLEEEFIEASVERSIYHLYSLNCKTCKIRISEILKMKELRNSFCLQVKILLCAARGRIHRILSGTEHLPLLQPCLQDWLW